MSDLKVLIVDDEPHILILLEQVLESLEDDYGVTLLTASDGETAWEILQSQSPQLMILDVMLPKISGLEICQRAKADPTHAATAIILLTAKGQQFDRQAGLERGADCYMTKPFRPRELLSQVKTLLGLAS